MNMKLPSLSVAISPTQEGGPVAPLSPVPVVPGMTPEWSGLAVEKMKSTSLLAALDNGTGSKPRSQGNDLIALRYRDRIMVSSYEFLVGAPGVVPRLFDDLFTASRYAESSFQAKFIRKPGSSLDDIISTIKQDQKQRNDGLPSQTIVLATHGGANAIGTGDGAVYKATDIVDRFKREGLIAQGGFVVFDGCAVGETAQAQAEIRLAAIRNNVKIVVYTGEVDFAQKKPNTGIIFFPNGSRMDGISI
jgi:hypothetical protein